MGNQQIAIGNGDLLPINQTRQGLLSTSKYSLLLKLLLHVPSVSRNLISIQKLAHENLCYITFDSSGFTIKDWRTNLTLLTRSIYRSLYQAKTTLSSSSPNYCFSATTTFGLWHRRLGHPSPSVQSKLHLPATPPPQHCPSCATLKSQKLHFSKYDSKSCFPLDLVHSNV